MKSKPERRSKRKMSEAEGNADIVRRIQERNETGNQEMSRRSLLIRGAAALAIGSGGVYLLSKNCGEDKSSIGETAKNTGRDTVPKSSVNEAEVRTDKLIVRAEKGADNLGKRLRDKFKEIPNTLNTEKLFMPFDLVDINKGNPNRNSPRFHRKAAEAGTGSVKQDNINYFGYQSGGRELKGLAAAYSPPTREMVLAPDFDEDNLLDNLVLYHELRHVTQDTSVRHSISSQAEFQQYVAFYTRKSGNKRRVFVLDEASAYMYEIEALNLLLDGALKEAAKKGVQLDVQQVRAQLNASKNQTGLLNMILEMGYAYYNSGSTDKGITQSFLREMVRTYRKNGYTKAQFILRGDFRNPQRWKE